MSRITIELLDEGYGGTSRHHLEQLLGRDVVATKLDAFHERLGAVAGADAVRVRHRRASLAEIGELAARSDVDLLLLAPSWQAWLGRCDELAGRLADVFARPRRPRLGLLDTVDQSSTPWFAALPFVDVLVKSQVLRDRSSYCSEVPGGFVIADWCRTDLSFPLDGWHFGTVADARHLDRLMEGWNMGVSRFYRRLAWLARRAAPAWRARRYDLNRRFPVPDPGTAKKWEWYQEYRRFAGLAAERLAGRLRLTASASIPRRQYLREVMDSRAVFSPFGWGEVCFRDFEAIACGCLLVKPDMSHLATWPDVYEPGVTYVPVRWDLADLEERVEAALADPEAARAMIDEAQRRIARQAVRERFQAELGTLLRRVGLVG